MGTFLYKIVNVHLTFIRLFFCNVFQCYVEFFFFFNGRIALSCWMFVSLYMHFISAMNRAAINIFVLAFPPIFCIFFPKDTFPEM